MTPNNRIPACRSDACRQGRDACPTPEACHLPADDTADFLDNMEADLFADAGLAVAVCLALAFVVIIISSGPEILAWLGVN